LVSKEIFALRRRESETAKSRFINRIDKVNWPPEIGHSKEIKRLTFRAVISPLSERIKESQVLAGSYFERMKINSWWKQWQHEKRIH